MNYLEFRKQLDLEIKGSYRLIKELPDHEVGEVWRAFDTGMDKLITIFTKDDEHSYNLDPEDWEAEFFYSYYDSDWFEPISDKPEKMGFISINPVDWTKSMIKKINDDLNRKIKPEKIKELDYWNDFSQVNKLEMADKINELINSINYLLEQED